jgi:shikimate dehydrogenase
MGNPVAHSKSPRIHQAFASQTSQSINYQAIPVPHGKFDSAVMVFREAGGKGLNVTVPFKEDAWRLASARSSRAETAGAVNTLWFGENGVIHGDNTDGAGLLRDLHHHSIKVTASRVLILGAGGAVRGVLGPLLASKPARIVIANRTVSRAEALLLEHSYFPEMKACSLDSLVQAGEFDLVINTISAGLHGEQVPLPETIISDQCCCYDMLYGDDEPVFVSWARQHGARLALDGLGMLVEQAAESFYLWRGIRPDTLSVIKMLRVKPGRVVKGEE